MKDILLLAIILVLAMLLYAKVKPNTEITPLPAVEQPPTLPPAPLLPEFVLLHTKPAWYKEVLNLFDAGHEKGSAILSACKVNEIRSDAIQMIAANNAAIPINIGQLCDIFDKAKSWVYVKDPSGYDYFAHPAESHLTLRGDCDDYAIYLSTLIAAVGFESDIVIGIDNFGECHAFPEVCLGPIEVTSVSTYLRARYGISDFQYVNFRIDEKKHLYLSLERGRYPGATPYNGKVIMRLYLTDNFIEQI